MALGHRPAQCDLLRISTCYGWRRGLRSRTAEEGRDGRGWAHAARSESRHTHVDPSSAVVPHGIDAVFGGHQVVGGGAAIVSVEVGGHLHRRRRSVDEAGVDEAGVVGGDKNIVPEQLGAVRCQQSRPTDVKETSAGIEAAVHILRHLQPPQAAGHDGRLPADVVGDAGLCDHLHLEAIGPPRQQACGHEAPLLGRNVHRLCGAHAGGGISCGGPGNPEACLRGVVEFAGCILDGDGVVGAVGTHGCIWR
mmetsp:Transcript_46540/g.99424  ORF Transcript_46540/g.99424 Transcript_46540/m.99424 type:complete len:250 (-) Transcript_46540:1854-2603(-)